MSKERSREQVCQTNVYKSDRTRTQTVAGGGMEWCGVVVVVVGHFVESDRALHTSHQSDQQSDQSERTLQDWSFPWWHVPLLSR